jgi:hypothetical protein
MNQMIWTKHLLILFCLLKACLSAFSHFDITSAISVLERSDIGSSLPLCQTTSSISSLIQINEGGQMVKFEGHGNFVERTIELRAPPINTEIISTKLISVLCGKTVSVSLLRYSLQDTVDPFATSDVYRPHISIFKYGPPTGDYTYVNWQPDTPELTSAENWNLIHVQGFESVDVFIYLESDLTTLKLSSISYDQTSVSLVNQISLNPGEGTESSKFVLAERNHFVLLYSLNSAAISIYKMESSFSLIYVKTEDLSVNIGNDCHISSFSSIRETDINEDHFGITFTCLDGVLKLLVLTINNEGHVKISNQVRTDISIPHITSIDVHDTSVLVGFIKAELPESSGNFFSSLAFFTLNSQKELDLVTHHLETTIPIEASLSLLGLLKSDGSFEIILHQTLVHKLTFENDNCDSEDCKLCNTDTCFICPSNTYLYDNRCFNSPLIRTYQLGRFLKVCPISNCADCSLNIEDCVSCMTSPTKYFRFESPEVKCVDPSSDQLPDGKGPDATTGSIGACTAGHCQTCRGDRAACSACEPPYLLATDSRACVPASPLPAGYGPLADSPGQIAPCAAPGCVSCPAAHETCVACGPSLRLLLSTPPQCTAVAPPPPPGFGLDLQAATPTLAPCAVPGCLACGPDRQTCLACAASAPLLGTLQSGVPACLAVDDLPPGVGKDGPASFANCPPACASCTADNRGCEVCQAGYFRLDGPPASVCTMLEPTTEGLGAKLETPGWAEACRVAGCLSCVADSASCAVCQSPRVKFVPVAGPVQCLALGDLPSGYGALDGVAVDCAIVGCADCKSDYTTCDACVTGKYLLHNPDLQCLSTSSLPPGTGTTPDSLFALPCSDPHCADCRLDSRSCAACSQVGGARYLQPQSAPGADGTLFDSLACAVFAHIQPGFGLPASPGPNSQLEPCASPHCADCRAYSGVCSDCQAGYYLDIALASPACVLIADARPGTGLVVGSFTLARCVDGDHCELCPLDNARCDRCREAAAKPLVRLDTATCEDGSSPVEGFGIKADTREILPCTAADCAQCHSDYNVCTACKTNFWLLVNVDNIDGNCVASSSITSTIDSLGKNYGPDLTSSPAVLVSCIDHCLDCSSNANICQTCSTGYLVLSPNTCHDETTPFPEGFGPDSITSPKKLEQCSVENCNQCSSIYTTCQVCKTGYYLYTNGNQQCLTSSNIPTGWGIDLEASIPSLKPCSLPNCQTCSPNYKGCTQCNPSFYLYEYNEEFSCFTKSSIPVGWGIDQASPVASLQQCEVTYCRNCIDNHKVCDRCVDGRWITAGSPKSCVASIPDNQGKNGPSPSLLFCSQANCVRCPSDYSKCETCATGFRAASSGICFICQVEGCSTCPSSALQCTSCLNTYPFNLQTGSSLACFVTPPPGYGVDLSSSQTGTLKACNDQKCKTCSSNHQQCQECQPTYYLSADKTSCQSSPPPGFGIDLTSPAPSLARCIVHRCQTCAADHRACTSCSSNSDSHKAFLHGAGLTARCLLPSELPAGFGPDPLTLTTKPCSVANCLECADGYPQCTKCEPSFRLFRPVQDESSCLPLTAPIAPGFGVDSATETGLKACSDRRCRDCSEDYSRCKACLLEFLLYPDLMQAPYAHLAGTCVALDDVVSVTGMDKSLARQLVACSDPLCATCLVTDASKCTDCVPGSYYLSNSLGIFCLGTDVSDLLPHDGYGLADTNLLLQPCDTLCEKCDANHLICEKCKDKDSVDGKRLFLKDDGTCIKSDAIPDKFGPFIDTRQEQTSSHLTACIDSNCKLCSKYFEYCQECDANFVLHFPVGGPPTCLLTSEIPEGYGLLKDSNPLSSANCQIEGCINCREDSSICLECGADVKYLYDQTLSKVLRCLPPSPTLLDLTLLGIAFGPESPDSDRHLSCPAFCSVCSASHATCTVCARGYLLTVASSCAAAVPESFADGQGTLLTASGEPAVGVCADPGCRLCDTNAAVCQACRDVDGGGNLLVLMRLPATPKTCYAAADLPLGYGADFEDGVARRCSDRKCKECKQDYTICEACQDGIYFEIKDDDSLVCHGGTGARLPKGQGRQADSYLLAACSVADCELCAGDYQVCQGCTAGKMLDGRTNQCVDLDTRAPGFGVDYASPGYAKFLPCAITGCVECHASATQECALCDEGLYLSLVGKPECFITPAKGLGPAELRSKFLVTCTEYCEECPELYSLCRKCNKGFFLKDGQCSLDRIPIGQGFDKKSIEIVNCTDPNCLECRNDINECFRCSSNFVVHPTLKTCFEKTNLSAIPEYWGIDGFLLNTCHDINCKICNSDVSVCEFCKEGYFWNSANQEPYCQEELSDLVIDGTLPSNKLISEISIDPGVRGVLVSFREQIPSIDYKSRLQVRAYHSNGTVIEGVSILKADLLAGSKDLNFVLKSASELNNITLIFAMKSSLQTSRILLEFANPFASGVKVAGIDLYYGDNESRFENVSIALTVLLSLTTAASLYYGQFYGFTVLYYHCLLGSQILMLAPRPVYWRLLLTHLRYTMASFVPLPAAPASQVSCTPRAGLHFAEIGCFVYDNLRVFIVPLGLLTIFAALLTMAAKTESPKSRKHAPLTTAGKLAAKLDASFGLRLAAAISPLWLTFALLNLRLGAASPLMLGGMVLSALVVFAYAAWLLLVLVVWVKHLSLESDTFLHALIPVIYDKAEAQVRVKLVAPIVNFVKTSAYCSALVFVQNPLSQSSLMLALFCGHITYLALVRPYDHWIHDSVVIALEGLFSIIFMLDIGQVSGKIDLKLLQTQFAVGYCVLGISVVVVLIAWLICLVVKRGQFTVTKVDIEAKPAQILPVEQKPKITPETEANLPRSLILRREQQKEKFGKEFMEKPTASKEPPNEPESKMKTKAGIATSDSRANLIDHTHAFKRVNDEVDGLPLSESKFNPKDEDSVKKSNFGPLPPLFPKKQTVMGKAKISLKKHLEELNLERMALKNEEKMEEKELKLEAEAKEHEETRDNEQKNNLEGPLNLEEITKPIEIMENPIEVQVENPEIQPDLKLEVIQAKPDELQHESPTVKPPFRRMHFFKKKKSLEVAFEGL